MLAWKLKWTLNGDRLDLEVYRVCLNGIWIGQRRIPFALAWRVLYCPQWKSRHVGPESKMSP
eukprot:6962350-Pyramimonas_sp.AAC.1